MLKIIVPRQQATMIADSTPSELPWDVYKGLERAALDRSGSMHKASNSRIFIASLLFLTTWIGKWNSSGSCISTLIIRGGPSSF
jgi:hypothetical protein